MWSESPIEGLFQHVRIPKTGREMAHTHMGHAADSSSCWFVIFLLLSRVWLLQPHGLWHARLPYPSPTSGACSNSCPSSQWGHPTILSSVSPFSSCLQSFPAPGSFLKNQLLASDGQSIGASASCWLYPPNHRKWILVKLGSGIFNEFARANIIGYIWGN